MPPAPAAEPWTFGGSAERALSARAEVLVGVALVAADTQRTGRRHRITHGADDRMARHQAGGLVTLTT